MPCEHGLRLGLLRAPGLEPVDDCERAQLVIFFLLSRLMVARLSRAVFVAAAVAVRQNRTPAT